MSWTNYQDPINGDQIAGISHPFPIQTISAPLSPVTTLQNATVATGVGTPLPTSGQGVASIAISGTFVATIMFEGQAADGNWYAVDALQRGTGNKSSFTIFTGSFEISTRGLTAIRANITSYTSGNITVKGQTQALSTELNGSKSQDLGLSVSGTNMAAGATVYGNWIDNVNWVRNMVIFAQSDQQYDIVSNRRDTSLTVTLDSSLITTQGSTTGNWRTHLISASSSLLGYSARLGIKNSSASANTIGSLRVQLLGL